MFLSQDPPPITTDHQSKSERHVSGHLPPLPDYSDLTYVHYLQNTAFILIPFVMGYYVHHMIGNK